MPESDSTGKSIREIQAKAFIDVCLAEYKTIRDEVLSTTGEFYRILQFGSTAVIASVGIAVSFWKTEPILLETILSLVIPTMAYVFIELLTGQVARIRKAARYCRAVELKLQRAIGNPFDTKYIITPSFDIINKETLDGHSIGWESWLHGESAETDKHFPWIYVFGILLFFFISYFSLSTYTYYVFHLHCSSFSFDCIKVNKKISLFVCVIGFWEVLKGALWYAQAKQIAYPLTGLLVVPKHFTAIHQLYMYIAKLISRFRQTADPIGIVVVGLQAFALYLGFGLAGPLLILTVAATGTTASIIHNMYRSTNKIPAARSWRNAIANAGLATLLGIIAFSAPGRAHQSLLAAVAVATFCATLSDTISHEIGEMAGGAPYRITTWKKGQPGDNGAITGLGTFVGLLTAFALSYWMVFLKLVPLRHAALIATAGFLGNVVDSILGATIEDRFSISNHVINFLSVLSAAIIAYILLR